MNTTVATTTASSTLTRQIILAFAGSLLIAVSAQIAIPRMPFLVPMTMQTCAVLLVGAALGSRLGLAAALLYLAQGAAGLPVFAQFTGGPHILAGPTAGYLFAFPIAAFITGCAADLGLTKRTMTAILPLTLATVVILMLGSGVLAIFFGEAALSVGVLPFLPGAVLKIALAAILAPKAFELVRGCFR